MDPKAKKKAADKTVMKKKTKQKVTSYDFKCRAGLYQPIINKEES